MEDYEKPDHLSVDHEDLETIRETAADILPGYNLDSQLGKVIIRVFVNAAESSTDLQDQLDEQGDEPTALDELKMKEREEELYAGLSPIDVLHMIHSSIYIGLSRRGLTYLTADYIDVVADSSIIALESVQEDMEAGDISEADGEELKELIFEVNSSLVQEPDKHFRELRMLS